MPESRNPRHPQPPAAPPAGPPAPPAGPPAGPPINPASNPESANVSGPQPSGPAAQLPTATDSGPAVCGEPHTYKTSKGEERSKPCIKAKGHSGPHSSREQSEKVDLSVVKGLALAELIEDVPGDDDSELLEVLTERVRSDEQKAVDAAIKPAHAKWIAAGKPSGVNDAIKKGAASRYRVTPEQVQAVRKLLRLAENAPENAGLHIKLPPPRKHADGTAMQYFIVVDKATRPTSNATVSGSTPAAAGSPTA